MTLAEEGPLTRTAGLIAALFSVVLMLPACSDESPSGDSDRATDSVSGEVLALNRDGGIDDPLLLSFDLASRASTAVPTPDDTQGVFAASWEEDGAIALLETDGQVALWSLAPGREPERLTEPLRGAPLSFATAEGRILVGMCRDGFRGTSIVYEVASGESEEVAPACLATLSPDGTEVTYSPDQRSLWTKTLDGAGEENLSLVDTLGLSPAHRISGNIAWGPEAIAFPVAADDDETIVIIRPEGNSDIVPVGELPTDVTSPLAWNPDGTAVAFNMSNVSYVQPTHVTRLLEVGGDSTRVLNLGAGVSEFAIWSPTGKDELLTGSAAGAWAVVDSGGTWLAHRAAPGLIPLDWR